MSFILALDQGTSSSRAILFTGEGRIAATAQQELTQHFPKPGWIEHDAREIWTTQKTVALDALNQAEIDANDLAGVGITNQRETTVIWDRRSGEPIHNAIVWQDRRTAHWCDQLKARGLEKTIRGKTGLVIDPYFSASKICWILDHVDGARAKAQAGELAFGTIDTWLLWKLTSGACHATDASNASRTMLYNLATGDWDEELLDVMDIPRELLPAIRPSSGVYDRIHCDELPGWSAPIAGVAGDQQAALFGQAAFSPGRVKNTYGTGCFLLMNVGDEPRESHHGLLSTVAWERNGRRTYALEGSVFIGGAVVQWLRDGLQLIDSAEQIGELAQSVTDNGGVVFVPAFTGLGAPHWDPRARGMIHGLTRGSTAGHIARAAIEAIAFQVADVLDAMRDDAGLAIEELRADGGAANCDPLLQFQADLLGVPVVRPTITETTALGAAYLAGLATGVWSDLNQIEAQWQVERTFEPTMPADQVRELRHLWNKALDRARHWEDEPGSFRRKTTEARRHRENLGK